METTRILWSGLTGRTGREAIRIMRERDDVKIVSGICRMKMSGIAAINDLSLEGIKWFQYRDLSFSFGTFANFRDIDVIVDFSRPEHLAEMVTLAVMLDKPLVVGTSISNVLQLMELEHYASAIPIFRGGSFRFKVKKFIDEAVELAMATPGNLTLYENFYEGKSLPSETSKVMRKRVQDATGKIIGVHSSATLDKTNLPCDWRIGDLHCRTVGFGELAHDVLEIAKVMAKKPVKKNGTFYDLDEIWEDLPH